MGNTSSSTAATCLVTGGAGFIGCALSGPLADHFERVVAVDSMLDQVHASGARPAELDSRVELVTGDVRDADLPDYDEVKDQIAQQMQQQKLVEYQRSLRQKARIQ